MCVKNDSKLSLICYFNHFEAFNFRLIANVIGKFPAQLSMKRLKALILFDRPQQNSSLHRVGNKSSTMNSVEFLIFNSDKNLNCHLGRPGQQPQFVSVYSNVRDIEKEKNTNFDCWTNSFKTTTTARTTTILVIKIINIS